ncbi:IS66 family insertion sequence element accessory protein TnpB [Bdellovibrionota bacterium FG-2]
MKLRFHPEHRVFVYREPIDMRAGFSKLQAWVTEGMKENLFEGSLFLFLGKNRRRAKILIFDGTGLVLIVKRLDRGMFMLVTDFFEAREIEIGELERILDGANLRVIYAAAKAKRNSTEFA